MEESYNIFYYDCAKIRNYFPYGDLSDDRYTDPFFEHSDRSDRFASVFNHTGYVPYKSISGILGFGIYYSKTMGMDYVHRLLFLLILGFRCHYQTPSGGEALAAYRSCPIFRRVPANSFLPRRSFGSRRPDACFGAGTKRRSRGQSRLR